MLLSDPRDCRGRPKNKRLAININKRYIWLAFLGRMLFLLNFVIYFIFNNLQTSQNIHI
ncbi:MAG: hypothetical protein OP8BY_2395 [Candidatus Saccharicenans subterraneus]|uniref:Uncharacterized protein n=1 Tax=Candidatus Saccharicenans subterraneus TaxID=2508984 RepID=A0A3E2BJ54_9BACT|nr:MAG: hypothetical protein OP8BY_2395 [Candidatus Saccharicenans subterraneum]